MASASTLRDAAWMRDEPGLAAVLAIWLAVAAVMMATLPALPVDETRYLTVAWEMKLSGDWLLPTLNGEPYSHKAPLLFWLINVVWVVLSPAVWSARLVPVAATAAVFVLTWRLGRELFADRGTAVPSLAVMLLAGPATFVYGALLMFDQLLTVWTLAAFLALWHAAVRPSWGPWIGLGLALGMGLLTKGPVVLLYVLPPALLARFWVPEGTRLSLKGWFGPLLLSVAIGAAMIFSWAVPAALVGGPEYAHMIFWEQSAGRMVESFHHRQPFWFYLPVLAAFLLPFLFWRPLWRAAARAWRAPLGRPARFLLCWLLPAFVAFCLISGKQPHYMLPLLPGLALLAASLLADDDARRSDAWHVAALFAVLFLVVLAGPPIASWLGHDSPTGFVSRGFGAFNPVITLAAGAAVVGLLLCAATLRAQALAIAASCALLIATVGVQASRGVFSFYDLSPLAAILEPFRQSPVAVFNQYAGEHGFMARMTHPVEQKHRGELGSWLKEHPDGTAILRHDVDEPPEAGRVVYSQPFRPNKIFSVMRAKPD